MKAKIQSLLHTIEAKYAVKILYVCESGSRAWGFASQDSDYDVRFLYVHPRDWYLSIGKKRDVIEYMNDGVLDINGWDIRKALGLLRRSNAPLREWLTSPIIYWSLAGAVEPVQELARKSFLPASLCYHYLAMAKKTLSSVQDETHTKIKSYLYTLRPLLCCQWIIQKNTQPPMVIDNLIPVCLADQSDELLSYVHALIQKKKKGNESTYIERTRVFETYVTTQIAELESRIPKNPKKEALEVFDRVFHHILKVCR